MSHLQTADALHRASPGTLLSPSQEPDFVPHLRALVGIEATQEILQWVGTVGLRRMSADELAEAAGIPSDAAEKVVAARELHYSLGRYRTLSVGGVQDIVAALPRGFGHLETEVLLGFALNVRGCVIGTIVLASGGSTGLTVKPKDIFVPLVRLGASAFVLAHNHPSGAVDPSEDDLRITNTVAELGEKLGIPLLDHVIVGADDVLSFVELGLMPESRPS